MSDDFALTDRRLEVGYKGRWRYRITGPGMSILFKRRGDAAGFSAQARLRGAAAGGRYVAACGCRADVDYKIEPNRISAEVGAS